MITGKCCVDSLCRIRQGMIMGKCCVAPLCHIRGGGDAGLSEAGADVVMVAVGTAAGDHFGDEAGEEKLDADDEGD